jgi:hypothetical protein
MLSWVVDNATLVYLILGVAAVAVLLRWRATRQGAYVIALGVLAGLCALVIILSLVVVTDRQRLLATVEDVARQLNARNFDATFRHFADWVDFEIKPDKARVTREKLQSVAQTMFNRYDVKGVNAFNVGADSVSRPRAVVSFNLGAEHPGGLAKCSADFVLVGEDWRVQALTVELPAGHKVPFPFAP